MDLSVTEIGFRAGFHSPSYFSKRFRGQMGCTPQEFRARCGAGGYGISEV